MAVKKPHPFDPADVRSDEYLEEEPSTDVIEVKVRVPLRHSRPPVLRLVGGPGSPREIIWDFERMVVGCADAADLQLQTESLAEEHVAFERRHDICFAVTLVGGGMLLNGVQVHSCSLAQGDFLEFGGLVFQFSDGKR